MVLPPVFRWCIVYFAAAAAALAQTGLYGRIDGTRYLSPTGKFSVTIPVHPELGGSVTDTQNVVTFQDEYNLHASIACFPMDATQRWENETRGRRDYLIWFFGNFVQADFAERFPGAQIQSAKFFNSFLGGALLTYNLLPGGTMFEHRIATLGDEPPPVAKRGNLLFVHDEHVYVLSTELAELVVERRVYNKTVEEQDEILRKRLFDLVGRMTFADETSPTAETRPAPAKAP